MLIGLAIGDAVGTTVEFKPRGSFPLMTDMVGGGVFNLDAGQWTDDTSMALCLGQSLLEKGFDLKDQMERYCQWMQNGYMSVNGHCFDIGNTITSALHLYLRTGEVYAGSTAVNSAGNGSIMRLAPVVILYWDDPNLLHYARDSSRTTHGCVESVEATALFSSILRNALLGKSKDEVILEHDFVADAPRIADLQTLDFLTKTEDEIFGIGYVASALEAALWCFYHTDSYKSAILKAANLGEDADTTAAICGQIAGAYYGLDAIPQEWKDKLYWNQKISLIAELLFDESLSESNTYHQLSEK